MIDSASVSLGADDFRGVRDLLYRWSGISLAENKRHLVVNRLGRRLAQLGLASYAVYLARLAEAGPESADGRAFINSLTTNKTSFFREADHFDFLAREIIGAARRRAAAGGARRLRLWCAAASTGEEPYTIAMVLRDSGLFEEGWDVRLLATDLDTDVLATAQRGIYEEERLDGVPAALRARHFKPCPGGFQVDPALAALVTFSRANLIAQPFPVRGSFDAVFCRNVMIYFDRPTQVRVVENLCRQLAPGGYLLVGHAESLIAFPLALEVVANSVYRPASASGSASASAPVSAPVPARPRTPPPALTRTPAPVVTSASRPAGAWAPAQAHGRRPPEGLPQHRIVLGQWLACGQPAVVSTLLGSCVAACLYDPVAKVGGMNHFMLPGGEADAERPARFGIHAMEVLINDLMHLGADRTRLEAKIFGAASVTKELSPHIAEGNAAFVREFLAREKIRVVSERLGGNRPHEVALRTDTGEAFHRTIAPNTAANLARLESETWKRLGRGGTATGAPAKPKFEIF